MTVLDYVREEAGLTGTKEGCSEGDCGACTVVVGSLRKDRVVYQAVNSCLMPAVRMHGRHIVTIEGLTGDDRLHPIQQAIVTHDATQCGFCTPGIIMSLFALLSERPRPTPEEICRALEGNLCRCTGYEAVRKAAWAVASRPERIVPEEYANMAERLRSIKSRPVSTENGSPAYHSPASLDKVFTLLNRFERQADYRLLAGGTDLFVEMNIRGARFAHLVDLIGVSELDGVSRDDSCTRVGANVTLAGLAADAETRVRFPALIEAIRRMGSEPIRNSATLAGNVANASPIADAATVLMALGATLILASESGRRRVPVEGFYLAYKSIDLRSGEIIEAVEIPGLDRLTSFEKTTRREAVDIASMSSCLALTMDGPVIGAARLALGGVAPTPVLLARVGEFLRGKSPGPDIVTRAGELAAETVMPISDVRGSREFRTLLVRNHVVKHFARLFPEAGM
jgi:xanthine dehydrogenase small subunit